MVDSNGRETQFFQRVYASLLAGAVGDAMGFPTEGHHYKTIRERWGVIDSPMVRADADGPGWEPAVTGPVYTDDTVMRHMVCRAIIDTQGHPTPYAIAKVWNESITNFNCWHWWLNTRLVGAKLKWGGWIDVRQLGRDSIACNDAAMIIAPVGLLHPADPEKAALQALDLACVWQRGYSRECAGSMAAAHAEALSPEATPETVIAAAKRYCPDFAPYVDRAVELAHQCSDNASFIEKYYAQFVPGPNEEYWGSIGSFADSDDPWCFNADPLEVCSLGIAFFVLGKGDAAKAISGGASFGRDCDTIAGIAGSLTGALYGSETLPGDWVDAVMDACPEPDIRELAVQLTQLAIANLRAVQQRSDAVLKMT